MLYLSHTKASQFNSFIRIYVQMYKGVFWRLKVRFEDFSFDFGLFLSIMTRAVMKWLDLRVTWLGNFDSTSNFFDLKVTWLELHDLTWLEIFVTWSRDLYRNLYYLNMEIRTSFDNNNFFVLFYVPILFLSVCDCVVSK